MPPTNHTFFSPHPNTSDPRQSAPGDLDTTSTISGHRSSRMLALALLLYARVSTEGGSWHVPHPLTDLSSGFSSENACLEASMTLFLSCPDLALSDSVSDIGFFRALCASSSECKTLFRTVATECQDEDDGFVGIDLIMDNLCTGNCTSTQADTCQDRCGSCVSSSGDPESNGCTETNCFSCLPYLHCLREDDDDPCFPGDATVMRPPGMERVPVEALKAGDDVVALSPWGEVVIDRVSLLSVHKAESTSPLRRITVRWNGTSSETTTLHVTGSHRVAIGDTCCDVLSEAGELRPGDNVWRYVDAHGRRQAEKAVVAANERSGESGRKTLLFSPVLEGGGLPVVEGIVTSPGSSWEMKALWYTGGLVTPAVSAFLGRHVLRPLPRLVDTEA